MSFQAIMLVGTGGALGAVLRYGVSLLIKAGSGFPWATLSVNVIGSLAMGLVMGWVGRQGAGGESVRLFLAVGLLGGFTTFSAFSMELIGLLEKRDLLAAFGYVGGSIVAGAAAFVLAYGLARAS